MEAEANADPVADAAAYAVPDAGAAILARWILGLRWAVFGILGITLPFVHRLFEHEVVYAVAVPIIVVAALRDVPLRALGKRIPLAVGVAIDLLAVAGVLAASGGAANPLSALFFVYVALAASLLPKRTTFALAALAAAAFATLFFLPSGTCCPNHPANGPFSAHLYGMWISFVLAAALAAFFLTQLRGALEEREREIASLRRRAEETARFAALGTLAAGTAHELATPLGTIGVLAGEIADGGDATACASKIKLEVERCREVITKMRGRDRGAGARGVCAVVPAVERAVASYRLAHPAASIALRPDEAGEVIVPLAPGDVATIVHALLDNAEQATRKGGAIDVVVSAEASLVRIAVVDRGEGASADVLARMGEPFFTTKAPGEGMGLGLYLVRRLLDRAGGRLEARAREIGTEVRVEVEAIG